MQNKNLLSYRRWIEIMKISSVWRTWRLMIGFWRQQSFKQLWFFWLEYSRYTHWESFSRKKFIIDRNTIQNYKNHFYEIFVVKNKYNIILHLHFPFPFLSINIFSQSFKICFYIGNQMLNNIIVSYLFNGLIIFFSKWNSLIKWF